MTKFLAQIIAWLNTAMNGLGKFLLAPLIETLPGWLSNTIIGAVLGVLLLIVFKYTSNQQAISRVKDKIKANTLALKLFKDSMAVTFQSQGRLFLGALMLLVHAIRPLLVMIVPVSLIIAQMALWYQARPLRPTESALVIMKLNGDSDTPLPKVSLESMPAAEVTIGPVHVVSKREIYWEITAREDGNQPLVFKVDQDKFEKELAIGSGFMPVSVERPGWHWASIFNNPREKPFAPKSVVQSISIGYSERSPEFLWVPLWMWYFFAASMLFALIAKPFLKVKI